MKRPIARCVIAGGGTAGWLAAASLAAWSRRTGNPDLDIILVEAPDIATIGVGEGTWPTIRETLADIGIDETEFLTSCDASFKQGSRFDGWATGEAGDRYYHPFTPPPPCEARELIAAWRSRTSPLDFAHAVCAQPGVCDGGLAPRQPGMPPFAGALNYAYHFDAGKFAELLRKHAVERLGVRHIAARIQRVDVRDATDIAALVLDNGETLAGDLFLDCTGLRSLLVGEALGSGWVDRSDVMFNDRALAAQVPVAADSPIASQTIGTAHDFGWLWDIGLQTRRGIGCVYSSRHCDEAESRRILDQYVEKAVPGASDYPVRAISFPTGHRERFWVGNCIAVGMSAGFIEPLEASAIVMIELSIRTLTASFPTDRDAMDFLARRFNDAFSLRWARIVEFLKLHYVLSKREGLYWDAHRDPAHWPDRLGDLMELWTHQPPSIADLPMADEIFPAASYQYVYYGLGGAVPSLLPSAPVDVVAQLAQLGNRARALHSSLPANRIYLNGLRQNAPALVKEAVR